MFTKKVLKNMELLKKLNGNQEWLKTFKKLGLYALVTIGPVAIAYKTQILASVPDAYSWFVGGLLFMLTDYLKHK